MESERGVPRIDSLPKGWAFPTGPPLRGGLSSGFLFQGTMPGAVLTHLTVPALRRRFASSPAGGEDVRVPEPRTRFLPDLN